MNSRKQAWAWVNAVAAITAASVCGAASAQDNAFKLGITEYTTHSKTNGVSGIGVPPGADAETGNATTLLLVYERLLTPNIGAELVLGIPPRLKAKATGTVAFLGDDVLSAKIIAPTFLVNYHFGAPGDTWRPYLGAGVNYTRFVSTESKLASDVKLGDSVGWATQAGLDYALTKEWGLFASVAALRVKSKLVAAGSTVLQTTIDFRPVIYSFGAVYRF
ncbi:MAG: OmpW family protein [Bacteriovorax sp.]|nr:OmpW family protein [Rhizobacter sp.]